MTFDISIAATKSSKPGLEALPVELMKLVTQSTDAKGKPILSGCDLCNLRSTSRRIQQTTFDDWVKRRFTTRKHMLSRASLQCLLSISTNPVLRSFVQEVAIGLRSAHEGSAQFPEAPQPMSRRILLDPQASVHASSSLFFE